MIQEEKEEVDMSRIDTSSVDNQASSYQQRDEIHLNILKLPPVSLIRLHSTIFLS